MRRLETNDRGVSPQVGYILILGFTILVALSLFLLGQGLIGGYADARTDAQFGIDPVNDSYINITYDKGADFTTADTQELYVIVRDSSGTTVNSHGVIFNESGHVDLGDGDGEIQAGQTVITGSRAGEMQIHNGSALQFIWVPSENTGTHRLIDEMVIPNERYIFIEQSREGSIFPGGNITLGNVKPIPMNEIQ